MKESQQKELSSQEMGERICEHLSLPLIVLVIFIQGILQKF